MKNSSSVLTSQESGSGFDKNASTAECNNNNNQVAGGTNEKTNLKVDTMTSAAMSFAPASVTTQPMLSPRTIASLTQMIQPHLQQQQQTMTSPSFSANHSMASSVAQALNLSQASLNANATVTSPLSPNQATGRLVRRRGAQ